MNLNPSAPAVLHSPGFSHYNVAWSPFHTTRIAVASSANYGIVGNGRLHIASVFMNPSGAPNVKLEKLYVRVLHPFLSVKLNSVRVASYETQDGLYDLAWSEVHENQLVTASGDGSLKLWDVTLNVSTHSDSPAWAPVSVSETSDPDSSHPCLARTYA
jgi:peroxin-7